MSNKCPVCGYSSTNNTNVARHIWGMQGEDAHDGWMEARLKPKGLSILSLIFMKGNIKLLAELLENEDETPR